MSFTLVSLGKPLAKDRVKKVAKQLRDYVRRTWALYAPVQSVRMDIVMEWNLRDKKTSPRTKKVTESIPRMIQRFYAAGGWYFRENAWKFSGRWTPDNILKGGVKVAPSGVPLK